MLVTIALAVVVFLSTAAVDAVQAYWLKAYEARNANRASFLSVLEYSIALLGFFAFFAHSWWMIVPEAAGLIAGSQWSIRRIAREEKQSVRLHTENNVA